MALVECFCRSLSTASPAAPAAFTRTAWRDAELGLAPGGARGSGGRAGAGPLGRLLEGATSGRLDPREDVESRVDPKMISACRSGLIRAGLAHVTSRSGRRRLASSGATEPSGERPTDVSLPDCRRTSSSCMYAARWRSCDRCSLSMSSFSSRSILSMSARRCRRSSSSRRRRSRRAPRASSCFAPSDRARLLAACDIAARTCSARANASSAAAWRSKSTTC
mmetsp:Transcript_26280/g.62662  ORF Transcript_26280/g.62662 Transcript_26280/m.62662 type:complete len:222 (+) Transcript_26280:245-910(+)